MRLLCDNLSSNEQALQSAMSSLGGASFNSYDANGISFSADSVEIGGANFRCGLMYCVYPSAGKQQGMIVER